MRGARPTRADPRVVVACAPIARIEARRFVVTFTQPPFVPTRRDALVCGRARRVARARPSNARNTSAGVGALGRPEPTPPFVDLPTKCGVGARPTRRPTHRFIHRSLVQVRPSRINSQCQLVLTRPPPRRARHDSHAHLARPCYSNVRRTPVMSTRARYVARRPSSPNARFGAPVSPTRL